MICISNNCFAGFICWFNLVGFFAKAINIGCDKQSTYFSNMCRSFVVQLLIVTIRFELCHRYNNKPTKYQLFSFCWWFSFIFVLLFITIKSSNVWCFVVNCGESVFVAISHYNPFTIVAKVKLWCYCGFKIDAIGKKLKKLYFPVFSSIYTKIQHIYKFIFYHTINCGYYSWTCDKICIQKYTIFLCKCW